MSIVSEILTTLTGICISIFLAFVLVYFVGIRTTIIGVSMEPTLQNGQEVLINRFAYKLGTPRVGDVVVFLPNGNENAHHYVKRVVACPGDRVQIQEGYMYVNGELQEEYIYDLIADSGIAENEIRLGEDEFFVIGDNCNSSEDSRSGNIGPIKKEHIEGEAWFRMASGDSSMGLIK